MIKSIPCLRPDNPINIYIGCTERLVISVIGTLKPVDCSLCKRSI